MEASGGVRSFFISKQDVAVADVSVARVATVGVGGMI